MKLVIFAILLAIILVGTAIWSGNHLTDACDGLLFQLGHSDHATFKEHWQSFRTLAAFLTPYDLIRNADANAQNYLALVHENADPSDIEAARNVLQASIRDIRRIHELSWELIF